MRTRISPMMLTVAAYCALAGCDCSSPISRDGDNNDAHADDSAFDGNGPYLDLGTTDAVQSGDSPFQACETLSIGVEARPVSLVFVLDTSGSMNCNASMACDTSMPSMHQPTPDPNDSRWDVFRQSLTTAIGGLRRDYEVGVYRYPNPGTDSQTGTESDGHPRCIPRSPLVDLTLVSSLTNLSARLDITPTGFTPTHDAIDYGFRMAMGARYPEARFVVLATDGQANRCRLCGNCDATAQDLDDNALLDTVRAMRNTGTRTYVIGVQGSDLFRPVLSRLAEAGGTAAPGCTPANGDTCHFDLTTAPNLGAALNSALGQIRQSISSCTFTIPDNPDGTFDPGFVNVVLTRDDGTMVTVPRDTRSLAGWNYSDGMTSVTLHGAFCDTVRALQSGGIQISFGCPTQLLP